MHCSVPLQIALSNTANSSLTPPLWRRPLATPWSTASRPPSVSASRVPSPRPMTAPQLPRCCPPTLLLRARWMATRSLSLLPQALISAQVQVSVMVRTPAMSVRASWSAAPSRSPGVFRVSTAISSPAPWRLQPLARLRLHPLSSAPAPTARCMTPQRPQPLLPR